VGIADSVSLRSRKRKLELFMEELGPNAETTVLDVGAHEQAFGESRESSTNNFFEEFYPWPERLTALGLHDGTGFQAHYPTIRYVQGDGLELPFADDEFDIVFSNAVVEHVGGVEQQRRFVAEAVRVGKRVFMTTPNRHFPIETHTKLPLVHWLPRKAEHRVYDALGRHWATKIDLLSAKDFAALFPGPVRVKNLGMTLVAIVD
jgi:SAM-dependent methyltransferase